MRRPRGLLHNSMDAANQPSQSIANNCLLWPLCLLGRHRILPYVPTLSARLSQVRANVPKKTALRHDESALVCACAWVMVSQQPPPSLTLCRFLPARRLDATFASFSTSCSAGCCCWLRRTLPLQRERWRVASARRNASRGCLLLTREALVVSRLLAAAATLSLSLSLVAPLLLNSNSLLPILSYPTPPLSPFSSGPSLAH